MGGAVTSPIGAPGWLVFDAYGTTRFIPKGDAETRAHAAEQHRRAYPDSSLGLYVVEAGLAEFFGDVDDDIRRDPKQAS